MQTATGAWSDPDPLPIDTLLDGTYRVVRRLGVGSMGLVYGAFDERLHRDVAIKVIRPSVVGRSGLREQFCTEARAMARVRHPNVVEIHAFGEVGHLPFFVMELVDGVTADEWARSRLRQVARAEEVSARPVPRALAVPARAARRHRRVSR
jgi:serine/threonine protein kinase